MTCFQPAKCATVFLSLVFSVSATRLHLPVILMLLITCAAEEAHAKYLLAVMLSKLSENCTV